MTKYTRLAGAAVLLMLVAAVFIFIYAPEDYLQRAPQRIFYLHVSAAIAAFACFAVVLVSSMVYLRTESATADRLARAAALVGVVLTTVTLIMGMLYAKPIWGTFWEWDARLTSTLVLWIVYAGYLLIRRVAEPGRQAARFAAVVGIFGFLDVPIVYFSVTWWRTVHPGPAIVSGGLPPPMLLTFLVTLACTLFLAGVMVAIRYRIETLMDAAPQLTGSSVRSLHREPDLAR
jgi:heme exporter protein C